VTVDLRLVSGDLKYRPLFLHREVIGEFFYVFCDARVGLDRYGHQSVGTVRSKLIAKALPSLTIASPTSDNHRPILATKDARKPQKFLRCTGSKLYCLGETSDGIRDLRTARTRIAKPSVCPAVSTRLSRVCPLRFVFAQAFFAPMYLRLAARSLRIGTCPQPPAVTRSCWMSHNLVRYAPFGQRCESCRPHLSRLDGIPLLCSSDRLNQSVAINKSPKKYNGFPRIPTLLSRLEEAIERSRVGRRSAPFSLGARNRHRMGAVWLLGPFVGGSGYVLTDQVREVLQLTLKENYSSRHDRPPGS
jgi:hypothetical protein